MGAVKSLKKGVPVAGGYVGCRVLAAATHESHAVPAVAKFVSISTTGATFVNIGGTATVPAADITDGSLAGLVGNTLMSSK